MNNESQNSLEIGRVLNDKWIILEFIAKGGMGEVYRAHQVQLKRDVAIKVISREWIESFGEEEYERKAGLQRFRNEVQAMARVRHPNVLQIFDYGTVDVKDDHQNLALEYIAMEYVPGGTLRATMSDEGFEGEEGLIIAWLKDYFFPVLDGVQAIHDLKMAHRDLKPSNVLMDGETPKIADFGLAHSYEWQPVTQSIDVKGTPAYMSPEHFFEFDKADHLSDIYSLGKILFEAINGCISPKSKPFKQVSLPNPDTPFLRELDRIIQISTTEDRSKRFASVAQLHSALGKAIEIILTEPQPNGAADVQHFSFWNKPGFIWAGIALAIVSVAAMGIWHLMGEPGNVAIQFEPVPGIKQPAIIAGQNKAEIKADTSVLPPPEFDLGQDGIRMRLVSGGEFKIAEGSTANGRDRVISIKPFYMDEENVSNYHFVEFLNAVKDTLIIENGVIKQKDRILFYLGEGTAPYEQIIYQHGRFHLRDTTRAAYPVVRVTWYGAVAYAAQYVKRLPTDYEWRYAASLGLGQHEASPAKAASSDSQPDHKDMHSSHMGDQEGGAAMGSTGERDSAMGDNRLSSLNNNKQWVVRADSNSLDKTPNSNIKDAKSPSLIIGSDQAIDIRYPWEGFSDVGFRCVANVPQ
jgi:serine/threonine-protein kinase